mmetsp:Transcript_26912/g.69017  ORF Transcript_26912/g.69017 Transcript_26912/m.69017 type:complete len:232 (+) Transcript_26912:171-866(+)
MELLALPAHRPSEATCRMRLGGNREGAERHEGPALYEQRDGGEEKRSHRGGIYLGGAAEIRARRGAGGGGGRALAQLDRRHHQDLRHAGEAGNVRPLRDFGDPARRHGRADQEGVPSTVLGTSPRQGPRQPLGARALPAGLEGVCCADGRDRACQLRKVRQPRRAYAVEGRHCTTPRHPREQAATIGLFVCLLHDHLCGASEHRALLSEGNGAFGGWSFWRDHSCLSCHLG